MSPSPNGLLTQATATLRAAGIDSPRREARWLLEHAAGDADAFHALVTRRAAREPLAYLLGHQEFWTLDLAVSPATLIPRPDSETLIAAALAARPDRCRGGRILDLGTGTGCLLLAALAEFPAAFGVGIDLVPEPRRWRPATPRPTGWQGAPPSWPPIGPRHSPGGSTWCCPTRPISTWTRLPL